MEILNNNQRKLNPNAGDAYGAAWDIMWKNFIILFVVSIIYGIISGPFASFQWNFTDGFDGPFNQHFNPGLLWLMIPLGIIGVGLAIFVSGPIGYSTKWVFLKAVRGEKYEIKDMFAVFQRNYWNAVLGNIVVGIIVGIGFMMLIVPGIIFACRLAFVPYLIIDREMEVTEALNKSWQMTKGYGWNIFFMGILAFFVFIAGLLALFFGVFISIVWISTAFATMYQAVVEEEGHFQDAVAA